MIKVGITGQNGFVGQHLYNTIRLYPFEFERIPFERNFFTDTEALNEFVSKCDVIVHLAAMNRYDDPQVIYDVNIMLVDKMIKALETTKSKAHVIFSSSSQENRDNLYGRSKLDGRKLFSNWALNSDGRFTAILVPNVFGPFGKPNYNSFIATFCHLLTHNKQPRIEIDGQVDLIYVGELVENIISEIRQPSGMEMYDISPTDTKQVSVVLNVLERFKVQYLDAGIIPELSTTFELNLFNTFRSYIDIKSFFPVTFKKNVDARGAFVEVIRLNIGGQVSFSTTVPGITRGNHYHTRKIERFAVIKGTALIQLRKVGTDEVFDFEVSGENPGFVDMPIWYTHNITNVGSDELYTIFWINEFYDPNDPDTYFENV